MGFFFLFNISIKYGGKTQYAVLANKSSPIFVHLVCINSHTTRNIYNIFSYNKPFFGFRYSSKV